MDLLSKKYKQAEEILNLKAEIDRLNRCLMESLTHEKNALDVSIKYKETLQEIKAITEGRTKTEDYLLGQEYTELVDRILDLITKAESEE